MPADIASSVAAATRADLATTLSCLAGYVDDADLDAVMRAAESAPPLELLDLPARVEVLTDAAGEHLLMTGDISAWDDLAATASQVRLALWRHGLTPAL